MDPRLSIRAAARDDREWAAAMMAGSEPWITLGRTLDTCRLVCQNPDNLVLVAWEGRARVGFVILQRRGVAGSPYLATIAVEETARGRGIGSALLCFTEDYFRSEARHLFLCVSSFNRRARALYERHGYVQVGELPDYFIPGSSEILMLKRLR